MSGPAAVAGEVASASAADAVEPNMDLLGHIHSTWAWGKTVPFVNSLLCVTEDVATKIINDTKSNEESDLLLTDDTPETDPENPPAKSSVSEESLAFEAVLSDDKEGFVTPATTVKVVQIQDDIPTQTPLQKKKSPSIHANIRRKFEKITCGAFLNLAQRHSATPSKSKSGEQEGRSIHSSTDDGANSDSPKKKGIVEAPMRPRTMLKSPSKLANASILSTRILVQPVSVKKSKLHVVNESNESGLSPSDLQNLFTENEIMLPLDVITAVHHAIDSNNDEFLTMDDYVAFLHESTFHQQVDFCKETLCLMAGHNNSTSHMIGDDIKGWLEFQLNDFSQGIFAGRVQFCYASDSNLCNKGLPDDMMVEVALNGVIKKSFNVTEFKAVGEPHLAYNIPFCVMLYENGLGAKVAKLSIRILGAENQYVLGIIHIYYA